MEKIIERNVPIAEENVTACPQLYTYIVGYFRLDRE